MLYMGLMSYVDIETAFRDSIIKQPFQLHTCVCNNYFKTYISYVNHAYTVFSSNHIWISFALTELQLRTIN